MSMNQADNRKESNSFSEGTCRTEYLNSDENFPKVVARFSNLTVSRPNRKWRIGAGRISFSGKKLFIALTFLAGVSAGLFFMLNPSYNQVPVPIAQETANTEFTINGDITKTVADSVAEHNKPNAELVSFAVPIVSSGQNDGVLTDSVNGTIPDFDTIAHQNMSDSNQNHLSGSQALKAVGQKEIPNWNDLSSGAVKPASAVSAYPQAPINNSISEVNGNNPGPVSYNSTSNYPAPVPASNYSPATVSVPLSQTAPIENTNGFTSLNANSQTVNPANFATNVIPNNPEPVNNNTIPNVTYNNSPYPKVATSASDGFQGYSPLIGSSTDTDRLSVESNAPVNGLSSFNGPNVNAGNITQVSPIQTQIPASGAYREFQPTGYTPIAAGNSNIQTAGPTESVAPTSQVPVNNGPSARFQGFSVNSTSAPISYSSNETLYNNDRSLH